MPAALGLNHGRATKPGQATVARGGGAGGLPLPELGSGQFLSYMNMATNQQILTLCHHRYNSDDGADDA